MSTTGYYRFPTLHADTIIFTCEDDLWTVPISGGVARRLTAGLAECMRPFISPDGSRVAFTGREEGHPEVFIMPAAGGRAQRLTFLGAAACFVVGWKDNDILFSSNHGQPFLKLHTLFAVNVHGGEARSLGLGSAMAISYGPNGRVAIGRNTLDIARWKRYRGGTAGNLWVDVRGTGEFIQLEPRDRGQTIRGNLASPMCIGNRIYFVSDHEGVGNLYSSLPDGSGLERHTDHSDYYLRNPTTDGRRIVYHAGGDLFYFDPANGSHARIDVELHSPRTQRNRKFVDAGRYLDDFAVHPDGHSVAVTSRGQSFTMPNWEDSVIPVGESAIGEGGTRYRLTQWLADGRHLVTVSDASGEEALEIHREDGGEPVERLLNLDIGRVQAIAVSPRHNQLALTNHRQELIFVDLKKKESCLLDRSEHFQITGISFSPDGRYIAYGFWNSASTSIIKIANVDTGETRPVTDTVLRDVMPAFDPEGRYLYFLSYRVFNPVYDNLDFDMNFPKGMRPCCIALRKDVPSPFVPRPKSAAEIKRQRIKDIVGDGTEAPAVPQQFEIDFDGIQRRLIAFPVPEAKYEQLAAARGRVFFTTIPVQPSLGQPPPKAPATLHCYDFETLKQEEVARRVTSFRLTLGGEVLIYRSDRRLRLLNSDLKVGPGSQHRKGSRPSRETGWLDLSRVRVHVAPVAEWRQMYREAWRLQRDNFWTEDMAGVDWEAVYHRYLPLLERVASRSEFSDLMWEMQGELGTSHCYEMGGDYRPEPRYTQGMLGADFQWDDVRGAWVITHVVHGDPWESDKDSPLNTLGVNAREGELLLAVNGRRLSRDLGPRALLVNQAGQNVTLTLADASGARPRTVVVKALENETPLRYREWVEGNRRRVHQATDGRVGYVHIPNMMGPGMSEFARGYLAEVWRDALIVDVRFNGGGHTSQLILEKLNRKRVGYNLSRWGQPEPYPSNAVLGPIVAITNEFAGSDGDIFSHSFKLMKLGTLIGKRTWGGVIGIWPRHPLADGTVTTQPEFSFWFEDTGWGVENYGTDPHIEVDIRPQDYRAGRDPQLETAIEEMKRQLTAHPPKLPDFPHRPDLALPTLPNRSTRLKRR